MPSLPRRAAPQPRRRPRFGPLGGVFLSLGFWGAGRVHSAGLGPAARGGLAGDAPPGPSGGAGPRVNAPPFQKIEEPH